LNLLTAYHLIKPI